MVAVHPPVFSRQGWLPHPRIMFIFEEKHQKSKELICLIIEYECIPEIPWFISSYKTTWGLFTPFTDTLWRNICGGTTEPIIWLLTISVITPVAACRGTGRPQPRGAASFVNAWICGWKPRWTQTGDRCILVLMRAQTLNPCKIYYDLLRHKYLAIQLQVQVMKQMKGVLRSLVTKPVGHIHNFAMISWSRD